MIDQVSCTVIASITLYYYNVILCLGDGGGNVEDFTTFGLRTYYNNICIVVLLVQLTSSPLHGRARRFITRYYY